jgi:type IV fimbrial biogenesis protein FimT
MLTPHRRYAGARGFTLIELLTVITVAGVLLAVVAPAMREQLANFRVRSAAEAMISGVNFARAEAARRNGRVEFLLSSTGSGWSVRDASAQVIQSRSDEGSENITVTSSNGELGVVFLPTGIADASIARLQRITVASSLGQAQQRQIDILGGGLVRMCDPGVTDSTDPRAC